MAFHPEYATNGRFFVNYTNNDGDTVISEFTAAEGRSGTWPTRPERGVLLTIDQPFAQPQRRMLAFGPDGYLYFGIGDGGSGGDPNGNGQKLERRCSARCCGSTSISGAPVRHPAGQPVRRTELVRARDLVVGCATRGASASTARPATCTSATSARTRGGDRPEPAATTAANYGWNAMEGQHCLLTNPFASG